MTKIYLEDVVIGQTLRSSEYLLNKEEIIEFASKWDPLPIHISEEAAIAAGLKSVTAPGSLLLAIKQKLIFEFGLHDTVLSSFGFEKVSFTRPGIAGDTVHAELEWIEARPSGSKPDRGVTKHLTRLLDQNGNEIMSLVDTVLILKRPN